MKNSNYTYGFCSKICIAERAIQHFKMIKEKKGRLQELTETQLRGAPHHIGIKLKGDYYDINNKLVIKKGKALRDIKQGEVLWCTETTANQEGHLK